MENYHFIRELCIRRDCKTYLVFHILNKNRYVLKMHECKDESHAGDVYKETIYLRQVDHPYIGKLLESFVHYDNINKTFYLVVVMPFYKFGNCYKNLKDHWIHKSYAEQNFIERLLVQVFELLSILNQYGICHLNLKPENVFYDSQNQHVILSDFGYRSINRDTRRFIKSKPQDLIWHSPLINVSDEPSKIDIWTIGMFAFAYMTTSVLTESEFMQLFQSTEKYNMIKMEGLIADLYSEDFVKFTMSMIESDNKIRPNIKQITATPFYKECFQHFSSQIISRKIRQKITPSMRPLPLTNHPPDILHYIWLENNNELCVEEGLKIFRQMCKHNIMNGLPLDYSKLIGDSLEKNNANEKICEYACCCLGYLAMYSNNPKDFIFTSPIIKTVIDCLKIHLDNYKLHRYAAAYFIVLSSFSESSIIIGRLKGVEILILALSRFIERVDVTAMLLNAIWNLCVEPKNCEIAIKSNVCRAIIRVYETHSRSPHVLSNASACLLAIITSLDVSVNPGNICIIYYLLHSLHNHCGYTSLVKYTLILLESLTAMNEEYAMQFIECQNKHDNSTNEITIYRGLEILKTICKVYYDTSGVILSICNVIYRVVSFVDLVEVMINAEDLSEFLKSISIRYKNSNRLHKVMVAIHGKIDIHLKYLESSA